MALPFAELGLVCLSRRLFSPRLAVKGETTVGGCASQAASPAAINTLSTNTLA